MSVGSNGWLKSDEYSKHRKSIVSHMHLLCGNWNKWNLVKLADRVRIVEDMEKSCYSNAVEIYKKTIGNYPIWDAKFNNIYKVATCKIMLNLQPDDGAPNRLLERILSGEINPLKIGSMTEAEINPEPGAEIRKEWELRKETKIKKNYVTGKKCPKCKNTDKIDFNQAQKSSIDDGYVSIGYVCESCGHTWS